MFGCFAVRSEKTKNDFTECSSTLKNTQGELNGIQGLYSGCLLNYNNCDSSLDSLEMEYDSLNSSYTECSSNNDILEMSKKTCDNDLRDVKAELSVCQEDLLFINGSLTTCNLEISNKDLVILPINPEDGHNGTDRIVIKAKSSIGEPFYFLHYYGG